MSRNLAMLTAFATSLLAGVFPGTCPAQTGKGSDNLAGAWRGQVQFTTGAFAEAKDLEFMYVFTAGGTVTESSNYDAAPPVPPAYGVWKKVGTRKYEAKYQFFQSKAVSSVDELRQRGKGHCRRRPGKCEWETNDLLRRRECSLTIRSGRGDHPRHIRQAGAYARVQLQLRGRRAFDRP